MPTVRDALQALDQIAPPYLKMGDDPTGLLVGDPDAPLTGIAVCLDVTTSVVAAAVASGASLIIAHHPLIYHPLKTVRADEPHPGAVVLACARAGIAVACAHTCWDIAPGGINDVLATLCRLTDTRPLQITYREPLVKIAVFVPLTYREAVLNAMATAGAGAIGNYDRCGFWATGTGTFRPLPGAHPTIGQVGKPEFVTENRLEMIVEEAKYPGVVAAMKAAHPYEEVAYDVYPLKNTAREYGIGRIGTIPEPLTATDFLSHLRQALNFPEIRLVGPGDRLLRTVAVCGGAGASLMRDALAAGADALVTSDVRHHEFVDAAAHGFCLYDPGHAATETPGSQELAHRLSRALPDTTVEFIAPV